MLQSHKNLLSPAEDPKLSSGFPKCENIIPNTSFSGNRYRKAMPCNAISSDPSSTTFQAIMEK